MKIGLVIGRLSSVATLSLLAGCASEPRVVYVPVPAVSGQAVLAPSTPLSTNAIPYGQPAATVVTAQPPPVQVEVISPRPSPFHVWVPGYWTWNGQWIWVSGRWAYPPRHGAVWVNGHWGHRAGARIWIGGHWR